jgi:hypothetical protein
MAIHNKMKGLEKKQIKAPSKTLFEKLTTEEYKTCVKETLSCFLKLKGGQPVAVAEKITLVQNLFVVKMVILMLRKCSKDNLMIASGVGDSVSVMANKIDKVISKLKVSEIRELDTSKCDSAHSFLSTNIILRLIANVCGSKISVAYKEYLGRVRDEWITRFESPEFDFKMKANFSLSSGALDTFFINCLLSIIVVVINHTERSSLISAYLAGQEEFLKYIESKLPSGLIVAGDDMALFYECESDFNLIRSLAIGVHVKVEDEKKVEGDKYNFMFCHNLYSKVLGFALRFIGNFFRAAFKILAKNYVANIDLFLEIRNFQLNLQELYGFVVDDDMVFDLAKRLQVDYKTVMVVFDFVYDFIYSPTDVVVSLLKKIIVLPCFGVEEVMNNFTINDSEIWKF